MKWLSFDTAWRSIRSVVRRFPIPILCALLVTLSLLLLVEEVFPTTSSHHQVLIKCTLTFILAFLSFLCSDIYRESHQPVTRLLRLAMPAVLSVLLLIFYFWLDDFRSFFPFRTVVVFLGSVLFLHLCISFIPYIRQRSIASFWNYNRSLFLLFLEATLFIGVLFAGIGLAIAAMHHLFQIDFGDQILLDLFIVLAGVFHPLYFLAGFPKGYDFETVEVPSKAYLFFCKYILIPLAGLYFVILYTYAIKIIIQASWPRGWVSNLILWFSVSGILAYLLNYINDRFDSSSLIRVFKRWYFLALWPLTIMLFLAIGKRISDYGITEERYIVLALAIWLFGLSLYFVLSKKDDIRVIPLSLALICLPAIFGPFNMNAITIRSQTMRLQKMLVGAGLWRDGHFVQSEATIEPDAQYQIVSQLDFLQDRQALVDLDRWNSDAFAIPFDSISKSDHQAARTAEYLGLHHPRPHKTERFKDWHFYTTHSPSLPTKRYQRLIYFTQGNLPGIGNDWRIADDPSGLRLLHLDEERFFIPMDSLVGRFLDISDESLRLPAEMTFRFANGPDSLLLFFETLAVRQDSTSYTATHYKGLALFND